MTPEEINIRAWQQMEVLSDEEVLAHPSLTTEDLQELKGDVWDTRIRLRDRFFNELWEEMGYSRSE